MKNVHMSRRRTASTGDLIMMMWEFADWKKGLEHFDIFHDFIGCAETSVETLLHPGAINQSIKACDAQPTIN